MRGSLFIALALALALSSCGTRSSDAPPAAAAPTATSAAAAAAPTTTPAPPVMLPLVKGTDQSGQSGAPTTVFVIVMENHNWADIAGSASAPYINQTLLPSSSYALAYNNPPGNHPSLPNYLWLEAGTNFGIRDDSGPLTNHQSTSDHLVALLDRAGISWKSYQEDISGTDCPLTSSGLYAPKHNPMVYFDDVTNTNDPHAPGCIAHVRPYTELAGDLAAGKVARYNFITPNLCDDMHGAGPCLGQDQIALGDTWLSKAVPPILASPAYKNNGVLLITWDEGEGGDGPIGMIVLSPLAKGGGYTNRIAYTHSSTLRTIQEIFGVTPLLRDAANATDLRDLFARFPQAGQPAP